jgi:predicted enzyme related to lactoylglutathione lyase
MTQPISFSPSILATIDVNDFKKALAWYKDVLGFEPTYAVDEMGWAELRTSVEGFTLGVQTDPQASHEPGSVVTFSVTDVEAARSQIASHGGTLDGEVDVIPGMVKLARWRDPDGNHFMFAQNIMGG